MVAAPRPPRVRAHTARFDDAWLKFCWAFERSKTLHAEIRRFQEIQSQTGSAIRNRKKFDAKTQRFTISISGIGPFPPACSLLLGEVLHGYRSALDNAAWAAFQRADRRDPEVIAVKADPFRFKKVAFTDMVVADSMHKDAEVWFTKKLKVNAPGVKPADLAVMRWAQRFDLTEPERAALPFALLTEKNNLDKHKTLQPILLSNGGYSTEDIEPHHCRIKSIDSVAGGTALKVGTKLVVITIESTGLDPDINVKGQISTEPYITETLPLVPFLNDLRRFMVRALSGFSKCPSDIAERLGL